MKAKQNPDFTKIIQLAICVLALLLLAFCVCPTKAQQPDLLAEHAASCLRFDIYANLKTTRLATLRDSRPYPLLMGNPYAGCPSNKRSCITSDIVRPNQPLLVAKRLRQYTCALVINSKYQEEAGWIPTNKLNIRAVSQKRVANSQWQGWWRDPGQLRSIEVHAEKNGKLTMVGNGIYPGHYFDANGTAHPEPYYRDFGFTIQANKNPFSYKQKPCFIEFLLIGKYLVVNDMLNLGGNVNFSAIYQKYHAKPTSKK